MSYADYKQRMRQLPPTIELAARLRDGVPLKQLAAELAMEPQALMNRILAAGFMVTGETERDFRRREMKQHLRSAMSRLWEPWMLEAICAQADPDAWFPEQGGTAEAAEAKRICMGCPARRECLDYALRNNERFGIYGGKSERERRQLLKERAA